MPFVGHQDRNLGKIEEPCRGEATVLAMGWDELIIFYLDLISIIKTIYEFNDRFRIYQNDVYQ